MSMTRSRRVFALGRNSLRNSGVLALLPAGNTRIDVSPAGNGSGTVWEAKPLRALFKPSTGFEDQGPHQRCKHSRSPEALRKPQDFRDFLILPQPGATVYVRLRAPLETHPKAPSKTPSFWTAVR